MKSAFTYHRIIEREDNLLRQETKFNRGHRHLSVTICHLRMCRYYASINPQTDRLSHVRKKDLLSAPGAGGLQCHLEMNLLKLRGNLSSPPEREREEGR